MTGHSACFNFTSAIRWTESGISLDNCLDIRQGQVSVVTLWQEMPAAADGAQAIPTPQFQTDDLDPGVLRQLFGGALGREILDHLPGICLNNY